MQNFTITFSEQVVSEVTINAETINQAHEAIESGNFKNDKIVDRTNLEIITTSKKGE